MLPVWFLTSRSPDWFAGRGRPPQAAARRAGLEDVEKLLTSITRSGLRAVLMTDAFKCLKCQPPWEESDSLASGAWLVQF
jgi:hypothetical protein